VDGHRARVAAAHEIGHVLVHKRGERFDDVTTRLPSSAHEEAIAEYAARLLLLPARRAGIQNLATYAVRSASEAEVTVHAAASRLGDPDQSESSLMGAVLWKMNPKVPSTSTLAEQLTPAWHLCPGAFVPIGNCKARGGSVVSEVAGESGSADSIQTEDVRIGSFTGVFRVHAFAWGSVSARTRLVLSVFEALTDTQLRGCKTSSISEACVGSGTSNPNFSGRRGDNQPVLSEEWYS
jgi:hypothetical protein